MKIEDLEKWIEIQKGVVDKILEVDRSNDALHGQLQAYWNVLNFIDVNR